MYNLFFYYFWLWDYSGWMAKRPHIHQTIMRNSKLVTSSVHKYISEIRNSKIKEKKNLLNAHASNTKDTNYKSKVYQL